MTSVPRYSIPAKNPDHRVVVGWDPPCASFYFQLFHVTDPEDEPPIKWAGASELGELPIDRCLDLVAEYADLPPDLEQDLLRDKEQNLSDDSHSHKVLPFPTASRRL